MPDENKIACFDCDGTGKCPFCDDEGDECACDPKGKCIVCDGSGEMTLDDYRWWATPD